MRNLVIIYVLIVLCPAWASAGVMERIKDRRHQVDDLLIAQKAYEASSGFLRENLSSQNSPNASEKELITAENADRSVVFKEIAKVDASIPDEAVAGKAFALRHLASYVAGILRQDPDTGEIYDRWPPDRKSAETMLGEFFRDLDRQEEELRRSLKP